MSNNGQIPTNNDLETVQRLQNHLYFLREQVTQTEEALKEAWSKVPYDPEIAKKPWRSDIATACRNCGRPTKWVHPRGYSAHFNKDGAMECPPDKLGRTTIAIPQDVWDAFDMIDDETGDTLEFITRGPSRPVEVSISNEVPRIKEVSSVNIEEKDGRPSEREN